MIRCVYDSCQKNYGISSVKVDVVYIDKRNRPRSNAFDAWFDSCFPMEDRKARSEYEYDCEKERNRKKKIGYREKCLKKAIEMAEKLGVEIPQKIKRF